MYLVVIFDIENEKDLELKLYTIDDMIRNLDDDGLTVNLQLTEQCNFRCSHCFYASGPHMPKGYMSNEVLDAVHDFIATAVSEMGVSRVMLNLIGGEPTMNINEFERCLGKVMTWSGGTWELPIQYEMSTNGWWLRSTEDTRNFLNAIASYVSPDGTSENLSIRISNSKWHWEFRKGNRNPRKLQKQLEALFEDPELFFDCTSVCDTCGHTIKAFLDGEPCECGDGEYTAYEKEVLHIPLPHPNDPYIHVDTWEEASRVVPSNPDNGHWGAGDLGASGRCTTWNIVTFKPNGNHLDGCCRGSNMPFGTVYDHPLVLLGINNTFLINKRPSCAECHESAKDWNQSEELKTARQYYEIVSDSLNLVFGDEVVLEYWDPKLGEHCEVTLENCYV